MKRNLLRAVATVAALAVLPVAGAMPAQAKVPDPVRHIRVTTAKPVAKAKSKPTSKAFTKTPRPKVTGKATEGQELKATVSGWSPKPGKVRYQWFRSGKSKSVGSGATYKLTKADVGHRLTVHATATKSGYRAKTRYSLPTAKVGHK
ncbi:MAG: hypothetical protein LBR58_08500 [Propionibacteriaceae bacterium]|jgi:hypothetical protein|nr:hypothetical protein [Propionibacteriaceae bacterium]